ncbi:MAG: alanine racemase [Oceanihabitans sp.]
MAKIQETLLEINLNALAHNLQYLKSKLQKNTQFLAVVKAFAYGSDAIQIAKHLQTLEVDGFAVAYTNEGVALRDAGITKPILVLHPQESNLEIIIARCLEPNLYNFKILNAFIETAKAKQQKEYPIHIKFNTGLNRLGFKAENVTAVCQLINQNTSVKVASIFSHLAASEAKSEKEFTNKQIEDFKNTSEAFCANIGYSPTLHICNTSGILNYPEAHFNMVRSGIGLYGFANSITENKNLKPIATLKSVISQIHTLQAGESLGYNRAFIAKKETKTATIPIGHADGISRIYGNGVGYVTINGERATIIGNVCMDMIMVDVSTVNCKEGDTVIIFNATNTAEHLAETANTISYELITAISQRVKRVFIQ